MEVRGQAPDQFFTRPETALLCVNTLDGLLHDGLNGFDAIVEPACGTGVFVDVLRARDIPDKKLFFIDVDATNPDIRRNFLSDTIHIPPGPTLTIGNPPFGKNACTAVAFFNRAARFSSAIAFIVPRSFRKASIQNRLAREMLLVHEVPIGRNAFTFQGRPFDSPTVFQVWTWVHYAHKFVKSVPAPPDNLRPLQTIRTTSDDFAFTTPEGAQFAIRRVGALAGRIFTEDVASRSRQSHLFIRAADGERVLAAMRALGLESTPCKYNNAGCPSISKGDICALYEAACKISPPENGEGGGALPARD